MHGACIGLLIWLDGQMITWVLSDWLLRNAWMTEGSNVSLVSFKGAKDCMDMTIVPCQVMGR